MGSVSWALEFPRSAPRLSRADQRDSSRVDQRRDEAIFFDGSVDQLDGFARFAKVTERKHPGEDIECLDIIGIAAQDLSQQGLSVVVSPLHEIDRGQLGSEQRRG